MPVSCSRYTVPSTCHSGRRSRVSGGHRRAAAGGLDQHFAGTPCSRDRSPRSATRRDPCPGSPQSCRSRGMCAVPWTQTCHLRAIVEGLHPASTEPQRIPPLLTFTVVAPLMKSVRLRTITHCGGPREATITKLPHMWPEAARQGRRPQRSLPAWTSTDHHALLRGSAIEHSNRRVAVDIAQARCTSPGSTRHRQPICAMIGQSGYPARSIPPGRD